MLNIYFNAIAIAFTETNIVAVVGYMIILSIYSIGFIKVKRKLISFDFIDAIAQYYCRIYASIAFLITIKRIITLL